ncbi:MAG: methyltransferase [Pirellulales bacterium]
MRWRSEVAGQWHHLMLFAVLIGFCWMLNASGIVYVYLISYAYHFINLSVYLRRSSRLSNFLWESLVARTAAFVLLFVLIWPYLDTPLNLLGVAPLILGTVLHTAAVRALGLQRTYYAVELGELAQTRVDSFPYNWLAHPMSIGAILQFVGIYLLVPAFSRAYPFLIPGHILLSLVTAIVEHFGWHISACFFPAVTGRFTDTGKQRVIDSLREWAFDRYRNILHGECSLHQYVQSLPAEVINQIDALRYADNVMRPMQERFPGSIIVPLGKTDEIYISRYNFDRGGDQGLFDKHYDGNLRFLPGASVVRSLIYLSSNDHLEVVFDSSGQRASMKTYDYGLLDFHKELHWVDGSYDPSNPPRILLKCNYYIDHSGISAYRRAGILLNLAVFYSVRAAMEYSKAPRSVGQKVIGYACNFFRRLNNVDPSLPVALVLLVLAASLRIIVAAIGTRF